MTMAPEMRRSAHVRTRHADRRFYTAIAAAVILLAISPGADEQSRAADSVATPPLDELFAGPWRRNMFNFEAPSIGPGPIVNLRRLGKDAGRDVNPGDPIPLVGDYENPVLKPEAAAVVKRNGEYSESGRMFADPSNQCGTYSPPYLFSIQIGMQMLRARDQIFILYTQDQQVRRVRLNSTHPRDLKPTPMGDSIGHYEGDKLVIDTVGIAVKPYTVVDRFGTPQSEAMHVVERYRLIDAKQAQQDMDQHAKVVGTTGPMVFDPVYDKALRVELTIEDPNVFTTPWKANVTYRRPTTVLGELLCAENNVDLLNQGDIKYVPTAGTPDF